METHQQKRAPLTKVQITKVSSWEELSKSEVEMFVCDRSMATSILHNLSLDITWDSNSETAHEKSAEDLKTTLLMTPM